MKYIVVYTLFQVFIKKKYYLNKKDKGLDCDFSKCEREYDACRSSDGAIEQW